MLTTRLARPLACVALLVSVACGGGGGGGGGGPAPPTGHVSVTNAAGGGGGAVVSVEFLDPVTFALLFSRPAAIAEGGTASVGGVPTGTYGIDATFADGSRTTFVTPGTLTVTNGGTANVTIEY